MRSVVLVFACLASFVVQAQSWELGSSELVPNAYSWMYGLCTAASSSGHLLVWNEQFAGIRAARFSADGEVLDPLGLELGEGGGSVHVASDGTDYVVSLAGRMVHISSSGEVKPVEGIVGRGYIRGFASNGRTYVLLYTTLTSPSRVEAVLLNRDGVPISGRLVLRGGLEYVELTSARGKWLITATRDGRRIIGEIGETDFPSYFQSREIDLEAIPLDHPIGRVAGGPRGFAVSWLEYTPAAHLVVAWHEEAPRSFDRDASREKNVVARGSRVMRHPVGNSLRSDGYELAVHGSRIYATYNRSEVAGAIRFDGQRSEDLHFVRDRELLQLSFSPLGDAAFWRSFEDGQIYAARMTGLQIDETPRLVSQKLPDQYDAALVSGGGVHLALWAESARAGTQYSILADDGTPMTPALSLPNRYSNSVAASDGASFLVVWEDSGLHGSVIATDGSIVRGPFTILPDAVEYDRTGSLVWDGTSYVLSRRGEMVRIAFDGTLIERSSWSEGSGTLYRTENGLLLFVDSSYRIGCQCGVSGRLRVIPIGADLQADYEREEIWSNRSWEWWSWTGLMATAVGGGHRFVIRDHSWGDEGFRVAGDDGEFRPVPYAGPHWEPLTAMWDGQEFLVTAGERLVRHAADGTYVNSTPLQPGTRWSTVAVDRNRVPIVLMTRLVGGRSWRLLLTRLQTTSSESARETR